MRYMISYEIKGSHNMGVDTEPGLWLQHTYHHFVLLLEQLTKRKNPFPGPVENICGTCYDTVTQAEDLELLGKVVVPVYARFGKC